VLVTNITMLEYMLIRQKDAPILRASQGTLEFIVLDEAHSYVGAQAAELSLLLRRVALAFGRRPEAIRYVATSATIGGDDEAELLQFLRDLSGAPEENIHLVRGSRAPLPPLSTLADTPIDPAALACVDSLEAGRLLSRSGPLREVREHLRTGRTISWTGWQAVTSRVLGPTGSPTDLLVKAADARDPNAEPTLADFGADSVLPTRVHVFHRTLTGLWACVDPSCSGKPESSELNDWPFGAVYFEQRTHCHHCQSIVLEWAFCSQCGEGALKGELTPEGDYVVLWDDPSRENDFEQTLDRDETWGAEDEDEGGPQIAVLPVVNRFYLTHDSGHTGRKLTIDRKSGLVAEGVLTSGLTLEATSNICECPACHWVPDAVDPEHGMLRSLVAGAPYLISQITPGVVGRLSPRLECAETVPFDGRQLITFTDARQGTARHAANIQIASERGFIRSFLYHFVQERSPRDERELAELEDTIKRLRALPVDDVLRRNLLPGKEDERAAFDRTAAPKIWQQLVSRLAASEVVSNS
jgi:hypothetical protein